MKKVGMVLDGGGLRNLYTAGVLDVLLENKIKIDGIVASSTGTLAGINYVSKQKGRLIRYTKEYSKNKKYKGMASLLFTGNYFNENFAYYKMLRELDQFDNLAFINSKKDFYVSATQVDRGETEYLKITNPTEEIDKLKAASSIPLISKITYTNSTNYLDGEISTPFPVDKCKELGYNKIIFIDTEPLNYRKKPLKRSTERLIKLKYFRYPKIVDLLLNNFRIYNKAKRSIVELERQEEIFAIRPLRRIDIKLNERDPKKMQEVYDLGVNDAKKALEQLKEYLKAK